MDNEKIEINNGAKLNPWVSIWLKPRQTMRQIIEQNYKRYFHLLIVAGGISYVLDKAVLRNAGERSPYLLILLGAIILGPIVGYFGYHIMSALFTLTGKWIGGSGKLEELKFAYVWSKVPCLLVLLLWVPQIILFGQENFTGNTPMIDSSTLLTAAYYFFVLADLLIFVWVYVILIKCIAEAHRFSAWKALANILIAYAVVLAPFVILLLALAAFGR